MDRKDDNNEIIRNARKKMKNLKDENTKEKETDIKEDLNKENKRKVDKKEISNNKAKDKITKLKNKNYIKIGILFLIIVIMYFGAKRYDNLVYPNLKLYNEDLSKLNEENLRNKINSISNDINNKDISIKVDNKNFSIKISDVIEKIDNEKIKNEIMNYGKNKFFMEQFGLIYLNVKRDYKFDMRINNKVLKQKINEICNDINVAAVNPNLQVEGENIKVIKGKNGRGIDEQFLTNKIIDIINGDEIVKDNIVLEAKQKTIKPSISEADLSKIKDKISTATTYFGGTGYNRGLNIANAASKINGTLLMPGEEFSYEDKVSPVELYNGYYMAPVIVNGQHKNAPGGGVCQVCTTLYNAELKAGILPVERYNHSKPISYVQKGLDATLATGSKNLRFKNIYKYPIYIRSYVVGGQITVEFWSNKVVLDNKKYTPISFVRGNVASTYLYSYNNSGKLINKKYIDTSIYK